MLQFCLLSVVNEQAKRLRLSPKDKKLFNDFFFWCKKGKSKQALQTTIFLKGRD